MLYKENRKNRGQVISENSCHSMNVASVSPLILAVGVLAVCLSALDIYAAENKMRAPTASSANHLREVIETSSVKLVLLSSVKIFQKRISPIDGPRCGFSPTCSLYGYQAIQRYGAAKGLMMTGDRLIRCNHWKRPGPYYELLPNGLLYDPVSRNDLSD